MGRKGDTCARWRQRRSRASQRVFSSSVVRFLQATTLHAHASFSFFFQLPRFAHNIIFSYTVLYFNITAHYRGFILVNFCCACWPTLNLCNKRFFFFLKKKNTYVVLQLFNDIMSCVFVVSCKYYNSKCFFFFF